jgi:hypothetical protein
MLKTTATLTLVMGLASAAPSAFAASPQPLVQQAAPLIAAAPHGQGIPFQTAEAPVTGAVTVKHEGGKTTLVFSDDFSTNPKAPALQVVLLKSATPLQTLAAPHYPLNPGTYTQVAPLKSYKGAQSYTLPAGVDLKAFGSLLIWCKVANATMAWAPLK